MITTKLKFNSLEQDSKNWDPWPREIYDSNMIGIQNTQSNSKMIGFWKWLDSKMIGTFQNIWNEVKWWNMIFEWFQIFWIPKWYERHPGIFPTLLEMIPILLKLISNILEFFNFWNSLKLISNILEFFQLFWKWFKSNSKMFGTFPNFMDMKWYKIMWNDTKSCKMTWIDMNDHDLKWIWMFQFFWIPKW